MCVFNLFHLKKVDCDDLANSLVYLSRESIEKITRGF